MEKAKILIVEDEAIIAMEIENQIQSLGYEVTSIVDTGEKAIKKAEEDKPDLILMDIRIKGEMDGIEAAEEIRNRFGIPVIFSTAYLDEERIERAKITMPFGYVLKPIHERDLKVTIEMALYVAKVDVERRKAENLVCIQRDLGVSLGKTIDFQEMLRLCMRAGLEASGMDCGGIYVVDPVTNSLDLLYHEGFSDNFLAGVKHYGADSPNTQIVMEGNPIYTSHKKLRVTLKKGESEEGLRAIAIIPVNHVKQIVGCLHVASHTYEEVPNFARNTLETIVTQIGDALVKKQMEETLTESEKRFRILFENIQEGFSLHELVYDVAKKPIDYRFLEINSSFERFTGQKKEDVIGKRVTEVFPGIENDPADWIGTYAKVVINNEPISFEQFSELLNKWYSCRAFKIEENCFAVSFTDITDRKAEES